ncbi:FG-GAP repeat domain-containing protein [Anaeromyxobacter paludicola]|uniref:Ig-like domain-containing protein n=1 Tax=Anaeromyxobacter paludicola TaxID=2918171 RepID=A0ABN6NB49_9BACT|nr:FG-GAP-like repeat-containing protein [Anaeromyxobacter paludicola]BDG10434.1 hypothetical protein AMPC_35470 [Anaeromyxobacter paludicola]
MNALLLSIVLGAGALTNFPRDAGGAVTQSAIGAQVDGAPAVVAVAGEQVVAFRADGSSPRGFPFSLGRDEAASGAPAAGDMDGDRRTEVAVVTLSGRLFLWSEGRIAPGFPVRLGAGSRAGPSFADVDGDGKPELLVGDESGRLHAFKKSGQEAKGWPVSLGAPVSSTASSSRFAGSRVVAVGCADGKVHVLDLATRAEKPGFPLATSFEVTGAPAFADLDDDGAMDLVVGSQDFKLYAVDAKGQPLRGFPVSTGYRVYESPAIGDLDGDGKLDVVFTSADGSVYAVNRQGEPLPGFPVRIGSRIFGGPVLGDVDRDGRPDVVAVTSDGQVAALSAEGRMLHGFPTRLDAADVGATPLLLDLAQDGGYSIFVGAGPMLQAIRAPRMGTVPASGPWLASGHDAARSGHFGPNPPSFRALGLAPEKPRTEDALAATWKWVSLDAGPEDPEPEVEIQWYRNGQVVEELDGRRTVPPRTAKRGERWSFVLVPRVGSRVARSATVTVLGTPPTPPGFALEPKAPSRAGPVQAKLVKPSVSVDGDPLTYRYEWLLDGQPTGVKGETFPADKLRKGQLLSLRAVAADTVSESELATVEGRVVDTPPGPVGLALEPDRASRSDVILARILAPATDADGDALAYHYRWTVDGQPRNLPLSAAQFPARVARKHQKVAVEVRAFDGELEGPAARAEVILANAPPAAPPVAIQPKAPRRGRPLRAVLLAEAADADGDRLAYRYAWTKNGKPLPLPADAREVPGSEVARGDRFEVEVWATDGEAEGPRARAAASVGNTPPTAPLVALSPERPRAGQPVKVALARPSVDADGDPVTYAYAWTRDGAKGVEGRDALQPGEFKKHERLRVTVTPRDATEAGPAAAAELVVENTPPSAPQVSLVPEAPSAATGVAAVLTAPATDPDGDPIQYRYAWTRDGVPVDVKGDRVPPNVLRHGETWRVVVTPFDGEELGAPAAATALVRNTVPATPAVALAPPAPAGGQPLECAVRAPAQDEDHEPVELHVRWTVDGKPVAVAEDALQLPAGVTRRGERWRCEAWGSDGFNDGLHAFAEVEVRNSPPGAPQVALEPDRPRTGQPLACRVAGEAVDPDGDPVSYAYAWWKNDQPQAPGDDPSRIPGAQVHKGDRWRCAVTASDGAAQGQPGQAERKVANTPPGPAVVRIAPASPRVGEPLRCELATRSTDPDGDAIRYRYAWVKNGVAQSFAESSAEVPGRLVKLADHWRCTATPFDGDQNGPAASSAEVSVGTGGAARTRVSAAPGARE